MAGSSPAMTIKGGGGESLERMSGTACTKSDQLTRQRSGPAQISGRRWISTVLHAWKMLWKS